MATLCAEPQDRILQSLKVMLGLAMENMAKGGGKKLQKKKLIINPFLSLRNYSCCVLFAVVTNWMGGYLNKSLATKVFCVSITSWVIYVIYLVNLV